MHQRPTLQPREYSRIDLLGDRLVIAQDQPAARPAQRLVRRRRRRVRVRHRRGMHTGGDQPGEMRHVDHEIGADLVGDLAKAGEIPEARIGRAAGDDQLRLDLARPGRDRVHVDEVVVLAHGVVRRFEPFARDVDGRAVGEVAAGSEVEAHEGVAGLQERQEHGLVHLAAGTRLDVGEAAGKQLFRALDRQGLGDVDELTAAVVAPARIALGIFVGHDRALRLEDGAGDDVFRRDELDFVALATELVGDRAGDVGIGLGEGRGEEGVRVGGGFGGLGHGGGFSGFWGREEGRGQVGATANVLAESDIGSDTLPTVVRPPMTDQQSSTPENEAILDAYNSGTLAEDIFQRFGRADERTRESVVATCAELHNNGHIDLLSLKDAADFHAVSATQFFNGQHFFCTIIPKLDSPVLRMMEFVLALVEKAGNDLAANQPNAAFLEWCKRDLSRAREIVEAAKQNDALASKFVGFALAAGDMAAAATEFVMEYSDERQLAAITALGRMNHADLSSATATLTTLSTLLEQNRKDSVIANALSCGLEIAKKFDLLNSRQTVKILSLACEAPGPNTQLCCARALWTHGKLLDEECIEHLLGALGTVDPAQKGTLQELDLGLRALLDTPFEDRAIGFLTRLFSTPENTIPFSAFSSFSHQLLQGPASRFHRVFVSWMLSAVHELCEALGKLLRRAELERTPMVLTMQDFGLSAAEQVFLCRKVLGYLFLEPVVASSVLVSVLRVCDDKVGTTVRALLVNPLLLNYGGPVRDYLASIELADPAYAFVQEVLKRNDEYLAGLEGVGSIRELHPSEDQHQIERLREFDRARRIRKEVTKQSVFFELMKHSTILYGKRSLTYVQNHQGERQPFEMELKPHSAYIELPRMEILDPIGLSYMLLVFRTERLKR
jgi:hypothetical protein